MRRQAIEYSGVAVRQSKLQFRHWERFEQMKVTARFLASLHLVF